MEGPGLLQGLPTEGAVPGVHPNRCSLLDGFAVQREIDTFALHLLRDTQADDCVGCNGPIEKA